MAFFALAVACGVVSALLFPLAVLLNLVYPSIFFGYFSYFAAGAEKSTFKYCAAANIYGAVLAYILLKLHPVFGGTSIAMMILVFFLAFFYVMAMNIEVLSKAFCTFIGGVCVFATTTIVLSNTTAWPNANTETGLLMALACMAIGWLAGFISVEVPGLLAKKDTLGD